MGVRKLTIYNRDMLSYINKPKVPAFGYLSFFVEGNKTYVDAPMMQPRINITDLKKIRAWCDRRIHELENKK